jgi:hypothetical protein
MSFATAGACCRRSPRSPALVSTAFQVEPGDRGFQHLHEALVGQRDAGEVAQCGPVRRATVASTGRQERAVGILSSSYRCHCRIFIAVTHDLTVAPSWKRDRGNVEIGRMLVVFNRARWRAGTHIFWDRVNAACGSSSLGRFFNLPGPLIQIGRAFRRNPLLRQNACD